LFFLECGEIREGERMTAAKFELGDCLPTLDAGRVRLRWLTDADVPALFTVFGDPEVTRYWGHAVLPDLAAAAALLADIQRHFRAGTLFQWGVEATDGQVVGTCTLAGIDPANRRAELGFALGRAHWGRGYMTAALPAVLAFAFDRLGLHRVFADTDPRNAASIRTLDRLGFVREGLLREHYLVQGEPQDAIVYGLLRTEWTRAARELPPTVSCADIGVAGDMYPKG
jgi:RimJ/RimL family protein N-acetyltransferase